MVDRKQALICGVSGQDGALLARFLLKKGYHVTGTSRDAEGNEFVNLLRLGIADQIKLVSMNPQDFRSILGALEVSEANEVYLLSGQSSVGLSFEEPAETIESIVMGTLNMLEACRFSKREIRQYFAGSIECFGNTNRASVSESTPFVPQSPYGVAKSSAAWLVNNYREAYGVFACTGILSNHESPLRPVRFVTQKIVQAAKEIATGSRDTLELGRLDVYRDWGWASEFVEAMWLTLQQSNADNYVISTGQTESLESFVNEAFLYFGLDWKDYIIQTERFFRPTDILTSYTDPSKASSTLGWRAETKMREVVHRMIEDDLT